MKIAIHGCNMTSGKTLLATNAAFIMLCSAQALAVEWTCADKDGIVPMINVCVEKEFFSDIIRSWVDDGKILKFIASDNVVSAVDGGIHDDDLAVEWRDIRQNIVPMVMKVVRRAEFYTNTDVSSSNVDIYMSKRNGSNHDNVSASVMKKRSLSSSLHSNFLSAAARGERCVGSYGESAETAVFFKQFGRDYKDKSVLSKDDFSIDRMNKKYGSVDVDFAKLLSRINGGDEDAISKAAIWGLNTLLIRESYSVIQRKLASRKLNVIVSPNVDDIYPVYTTPSGALVVTGNFMKDLDEERRYVTMLHEAVHLAVDQYVPSYFKLMAGRVNANKASVVNGANIDGANGVIGPMIDFMINDVGVVSRVLPKSGGGAEIDIPEMALILSRDNEFKIDVIVELLLEENSQRRHSYYELIKDEKRREVINEINTMLDNGGADIFRKFVDMTVGDKIINVDNAVSGRGGQLSVFDLEGACYDGVFRKALPVTFKRYIDIYNNNNFSYSFTFSHGLNKFDEKKIDIKIK